MTSTRVFVSGTVLTMDRGRRAAALVIRDGRIAAVGNTIMRRTVKGVEKWPSAPTSTWRGRVHVVNCDRSKTT